MTPLTRALAEIDAANSADPTSVTLDGRSVPAELLYGQRMSAMLEHIAPEASELLRIAVRAQHIRRWEIPRSSYPMDRPGYLRWRKELGRKHAEWTSKILARCGYDAEDSARVSTLLRKENLRRDPETQTLEDTAALVFLAYYAEEFAQKHATDKVIAILIKTLAKMSDHGKAAALELDLPAPVRGALDAALAQAAAS